MPSTVPVCVTPVLDVERARDAEVGHLRLAVAVQQHVLRLHVAVDEARARARTRARPRSRAELDRARTGSGPVRVEELLQVLAVDVLEDDELAGRRASPRSITVTMFGCESCATDARLAAEPLDVLRRRRRSAGGAPSARRSARAAGRAPCRRSTCPPVPTSSSELVAVGDHVTDHRSGSRRQERARCPRVERGLPRRLRENRFERLVPGAERLVQLGIGDHERAEDADAVRVGRRP